MRSLRSRSSSMFLNLRDGALPSESPPARGPPRSWRRSRVVAGNGHIHSRGKAEANYERSRNVEAEGSDPGGGGARRDGRLGHLRWTAGPGWISDKIGRAHVGTPLTARRPMPALRPKPRRPAQSLDG